MEERDKQVKKILHRLISEECTKLTSVAGRLSVLNHQSENFASMRDETKEEVIVEMFKLMEENGWHGWIAELKHDALFKEMTK